MAIIYTKKTIESASGGYEYIEASFDDSPITLSIPTDPANSDYQAYLATLAANSATPQA